MGVPAVAQWVKNPTATAQVAAEVLGVCVCVCVCVCERDKWQDFILFMAE